MTKLLIITATLIGIRCSMALHAQSLKKQYISPLYKGDKVPDVSLGRLINYKTPTGRFGDFKGKLLILDFWATWCAPCIASLPKMDSLQKKYGDKIAIIPVNAIGRGDNESKTKKYFADKHLGLPSVVEDSVLLKMFPHVGIPHEVWINGAGVIITTTGEEEVTETNIDQYLKTGTVNVKEKVDVMDFTLKKPLFVEGNAGSGNNFLYRSIFTSEISGIAGGMRQEISLRDTTLVVKSITTVNQGIIQLYANVLLMGTEPSSVNATRFIIETRDSSFHPWDYKTNSWRRDSLYSYNLNLPEPVDNRTFYRQYMLEDLNRAQRHYKGRVEKRMIPSLVLIRTGKGINPLVTADDTSHSRLIYSDLENNYLENVQSVPFDNFVRYLHLFFYTSPPIFNETGLSKEPVTLRDLHLKYEKDKACLKRVDVAAWRAALQKYGFDIKEELREVEVLILSKTE